MSHAQAFMHHPSNLIAQIMDGFDDIVWSLALPNLAPLYFNTTAAKVYQFSCSDLLDNGYLWLDMIAIDDQPKMQQAIALAQKQGASQITYRIQPPHGDIRCFSARLKIFKDALGIPIRLDAIAQEISHQESSNIDDRQNADYAIPKLTKNHRHANPHLYIEGVILQSESSYRQIVQQQSDLILRSLPDTTITFANDSLCRMLGSTLEQVLGKRWIDFADPDDLQSVLSSLSTLSPEQSSFIALNRDRRPNDQIGWTQWINQGVFNEQGELVEIQSVGRDITDLKRSELALTQLNEELEQRIEQRTADLRQSEARNLAIIHALPDLLLLLKPDGTCVQCIMPSTDDQSKYLPIQHHIAEVLSPEDLAAQLRLYEKAIATGEVQIYEHQLTKFGKTVYEEVRIAPYCEDELLVIVRDVTDRKIAEELLVKSDAHLKTALRISKLGSWELDLQTGNVVWSEEVFHIFGCDPAIGTPTYPELRNYVHPDDWEYFDQIVQTAIATTESYDVEYRVCWADGKLLDVLSRGEVICDQLGQPMQIVGTVMDITDRKKTEQQLQNLTDRLTLAMKSAAIGIWEWDIAHNCLVWDARTYELYGVNPDQSTDAYLAWASRVHPSDRAGAETAVQMALNGEQEYEPEFRIVLPDGKIRYLKAYALVQRNDEGLPQRLIGINFDITNRKLAEELLLKSDTHLKTAQRIGKIGSWEYEIETGHLTWSDEVFRIYGLEPSANPPTYEQLQLYIHPEDWQHFHQTVQAAINEEQSYDLEHRLLQPDGTLIYVLARGEMIYNSERQLTHIIGTAMDITDRKLAEAELHRSRDLHEAIFNESTDALFLVDKQTLLTIDCNRLAVQLFEANDKAELIGIAGHTLQRSLFSDAEIAAIDLELETKGFWSREIEYISRKGRYFWGNLAAKPIVVAGNTINLVRVTDISDRKLAEAKIIQTAHQLENTNRELESFSYSVSHDLRAPLRHMNGFVNALQQRLKKYEALNDPKVAHYLQVIESSSQKMGYLIDGLLTLSRYGRRPLESKQVSIRALVDEAIEIIRTDPNHNQSVEFVISDLPTTCGDPTLLQQVFRNLIGNAVKFSRNHPHPYIEIDSLPDQTIRIKDNGVGFQMEYADKLFGAFQRLHNEKEFEGTGIGLAIVQRIVQRHGGSIWAEGYPDQGATFFIKI
jgi:PAS domain S-box-containing protein